MSQRSSRLGKERLEAALQEVCDDQPEARAGDKMMIHGHEKTGGVDPNFVGLLHDKLAEKVDEAEPNGLRAPHQTAVLSSQELAALDDDDEVDNAQKVVIDTKSHGVIDQVDSKLVTELNKKLCNEAAHTKHEPSNGFSSDLSAALEKKLGGQAEPKNHGTIDAINNDLIAAVERKLGHQTTSGDLEEVDTNTISGMRAPQPTVQLSAALLNDLDDEDEVEDRTVATHGAIDGINDNLVLELQRKLAHAGEDDENADNMQECELADPEPKGCQARHNTCRLSADMMNALEIEDDEPSHNHGALDGIDSNLVAKLQQKLEADADDVEEAVAPRGCRAPQPTMKLTQDMLQDVDMDIEDSTTNPGVSITEAAKVALGQEPCQDVDTRRSSGEFDPSFAASLHHQLADKTEDHGGLRAPQPTQLLSSDMLANLDDEEDVPGDVLQNAVAALQAEENTFSRQDSVQSIQTSSGQQSEDGSKKKPKRTISFRNSNGMDKEFAASLAKKLGQGMPSVCEDELAAVVVGTKAPHTTTTLTDNMLDEVWKDDEDVADNKFDGGRIAPQPTQVLSADTLGELENDDVEDDTNLVMKSGMKAPQCTAVLTMDQLDQLDDDSEQPQPQQSAERQIPPSTAESDFAAKVIQNMQDLPSGNTKPVNSSIKLRLAWLSDDDVRKENDSLRREIASLRAQIEMHRKEASFGRK